MQIRTKMMSVVRKSAILSIIRKILTKEELARAKYLYNLLDEYFTPNNKLVLDIGSGTCLLAELIRKKAEKEVVAVDINDFNLSEVIQPIIYDGSCIPFGDQSFDLSTIICVLHHAPKQEALQILEEAKRVSKKVLIMEDIYYNSFQKYYTYFLDSVTNFEFFGHPHSNRTDREWQSLFNDMGYKMESVKYANHNSFQFAIYYLSCT